MDDLLEGKRVLYRWTPGDDWTEDDRILADVADEYILVEVDNASRVMVYARYGLRLVPNPWSKRPLIAHLLGEVLRG